MSLEYIQLWTSLVCHYALSAVRVTMDVWDVHCGVRGNVIVSLVFRMRERMTEISILNPYN